MKTFGLHVLATIGGAASGLAAWLGGFAFLAFMSDRYDDSYNSTSFFGLWGGRAVFVLVSGWVLVPAGAIAANVVVAGVRLARHASRSLAASENDPYAH